VDIDIDLAPGVEPKELFPQLISASRVEHGELKEHLVGFYLQQIPVDEQTGFAAIPHKHTEQFGYFKIDMLTVNLLENFESKEEMRRLQRIPPDWRLLQIKKVVETLFHLGKHYDILSRVKPTSIQALADVFALIRPNKRVLLDKYLKDPDTIRIELFTKREPSDMRKAHAIPYALLIVLQLHLIKQGRL
jgi:hypothetical protein